MHVLSRKWKIFVRKFKKNKSSQKRKPTSPRSEAVISQNNDESIRRRNRNAARNPKNSGGDSKRISHQHGSSPENNKNESANTSKHSVLSLDWKDHHDPDERDE